MCVEKCGNKQPTLLLLQKCPLETPFSKQSCLPVPPWWAGGGERVTQSPAFLGCIFCRTKPVLGASFHGMEHFWMLNSANHGRTSSLVVLLHLRTGAGCVPPLPPPPEHGYEPRFSLMVFFCPVTLGVHSQGCWWGFKAPGSDGRRQISSLHIHMHETPEIERLFLDFLSAI